ncbi:hypothetical protein CDL15_Pgr003998 [Punica granatum]|uniref:Aminodeoxychorismate lyase n=1 Tax=Punica granatum TaxID=22663 RepID=A0A218WNY4_PUNGR|nr:hypothetical protein CDL15_Pgr003998 [Punica granatum]PKI76465.1 hypothetical protein CRG98_003136 [Punica granatum]
MYSSVFGGIILDPAMMVLPVDDRMVHRGHGVFDTAINLDGYLYELDVHLDRFLRSVAKARISSDPVTCSFTARYSQKQVLSVVRGSSLVLADWITSG